MDASISLLLVALLYFTACTRADDEASGETPPAQYAAVEVTVRRCADAACTTLLEVPGARVFLYPSEEELADDRNVAFEGTTGGNGKFTFASLDLPAYWLRIVLPQPDGRQQHEYVRTPARSKSLVEIIFPI